MQWFSGLLGSLFDQPSENSILETHGAIPKTPETMNSLTLLTPFCVRTKIAGALVADAGLQPLF